MAKIKVSDARGLVLDWLVARAKGIPKEELYIQNWGRSIDGSLFRRTRDEEGNLDGRYMTGPDLIFSRKHEAGAPVIDEALISTGPVFSDGKFYCWEAFGHDLAYDETGEYIDGSDHRQYGPTRLVAGLRCYVASKLGEEVEVPDELFGDKHGE